MSTLTPAYWEIAILDENGRWTHCITHRDTCASLCNDLQQANAERIVACVNPCEGNSDPMLVDVNGEVNL